MTRIVVIGAGGHAREVVDLLLGCQVTGQAAEPIGFIDEDPANHRRTLHGLPILGDYAWFDRVLPDDLEVICAVGAPRLRRRLVEQAEAKGLRFTSAISSQAVISPHARIGRGVMIFPNAVVSTDVVIGDHVILNVAATVSHESRIGNHCTINPGTHIAGNVVVGEGAYIGMGANVIQGISIGSWSVIGAGAAVVRDVPTAATAVGVPARPIKTNRDSE